MGCENYVLGSKFCEDMKLRHRKTFYGKKRQKWALKLFIRHMYLIKVDYNRPQKIVDFLFNNRC